MKKLFTFFILAACLVIMGNTANAQTNPTAQTLPYSQNFSTFTGSITTYPAGLQGWATTGTFNSTFSTATPTSDQNLLASQTNAAATAYVGDLVGKMGILSTGSAIRSICLAIVTTGKTSIQVSFTASTQGQTSAGRIGEMGLQYRVGTSGSFTNVASSTYQNNATSTINTGTAASNSTTVNATLPAACDNAAIVQVRWILRDVSGSGNRPSFSIDDLSVTGTAAPTPTLTLANNGAQPSAGNINQSSTDNILQTFTVTEGNTAAATLTQVTIPLAGTYLAADLIASGVKLYSNTSNTFAGATLLSSKTAAASGSGETITFNALSTSITQNTVRYFWVTVDVSATANTSRNINASGLTASNFTFASGTPTGTVSSGGVQTFAAVTPSIAVTGVSPAAGTINQNTTNNILYSTQLDVTVANATLNSFTVTTAGTYQTSDLQASSFKFWINSVNNLTGATQLGTGQTIVFSGNTVAVTGLSQVITSGTTRYILVTCDVAYNANSSRNISITSTPFSNIVFATGTLTGTDPASAGSTQTFGAVTPSIAITGLGPSAGSISRSAVKVPLYQMSFAVTTNTTDLNSIVVTTGGTYVSGDLVASSFKLWYSTTNSLAGASQIGTSQAIVNTGNTITFSGLTQNIVVGTTGFVWVTVDISASATFSNTINITSTPFTNITFSAGSKTGTDPAAAGGAQTISPVSSATDYFRSNVNANSWGPYNVAGNWESSPDSSSWITSTLVPTSSAARIMIRSGHTISLNTATTTIGRIMVLNGGNFRDTITSSTIAEGTNDDIIVQSGGIFAYAITSTAPTYQSGATLRVQTGGILQVLGGGNTASGSGVNVSNVIYENGSILDYAVSSGFSTSGVTYFPNVDATTIPIFRVSNSFSAGANSSTTFNGVFQVANGITMTWTGTANKIFRNGITSNGTGTVTTAATCLFVVNGATADLGGTGGTVTITNPNANGLTVTGSTLNVNGTATLGSTAMTGGSSPSFTGTTTGTISVNALSQVSGFTNSFVGTYRFTGSTLPATSCANLSIPNATTLSGDLTVSGTLTLNNTLAIGSNTLTISSPLAGTLTNLSSTSSSNITINGNNASIHIPSSITALNNLTISNNQIVTADANITVSGTYDQSNGVLVIGNLEIGTGIGNVGALTRSGGSVRGTIKRWFATSTATTLSLFPLDNGSASYVAPAISFTGAGPSTGGSLTATYFTSGSGSLPGGFIPAPSLHVNFINLAPQYWTISAGDGLAGFTYNIQLVANSMNVSTTNYQYTGIVKRPDSFSAWAWDSTHHATTTSPSAIPTLGGTGFTSFSDFGVAGNQDNLLPVEMASFTSTVSGRNVNLNWTTITETNNSGFDIERKSTTTNWIKIGSVAGHGTTNQQTAYSFSDANVTAAKFNYRLKQTDYNGNFHYYELTNEVIIGAPTKYALAQNFPNPFNPTTTISYEIPNSNFVSLKIYDMMGKEVANLVNENQEAGFYTVKLDASKLSSGVYFYKLVSDKFTATKKLMLLK